jgi:general secretion pathway protein F
MPRFEYRALRPTGTEIAGELIAADERDAAARLQAAGSYPIEITQPAGRRRLARHHLARHWARGGRRLAARELILFTRQLAALIGAGVALDRALGLIGAARGREAGRRLAVELLAAVNRGESLSYACRSHPGLPRHYAMIIAAGEARGDLGAALERLAQVVERSRATSRALIDALIYPASVLVVAVVSISFLLGFVVPRFEVLLTSVEREPPLAMRILLALSTAFQTLALPGAVIVLGLIGLFAARYRDAGFRLAVHRRLLGVPGLGPLIGKIETERMFYLLGNLVSAGVALPAALAATRAAMTSEAFRAGLLLTEQGIERGDGIATAFAASLVLPEVAGELVHIGEETGDLAAMLLKAGDILRREFEATSVELIAIVTPISIVLLGLLIGAVAAAILSTVMEVYDLAL